MPKVLRSPPKRPLTPARNDGDTSLQNASLSNITLRNRRQRNDPEDEREDDPVLALIAAQNVKFESMMV